MTTGANDVDFDSLLRNATNLPSLPAVAMQVLELGEDPTSELMDIASAVTNDPALCVRLLRAANSPLYASRRQIDNLRQAISVLGLNTTITLALSFSLEPPDNGGCVDKKTYWRRSLISAIAARVTAEQVTQEESGHFFLAALLQDIGMLVLEKTDPERYATIMLSSKSHEQYVRAEIQTFGFDHALVGSYLLKKWKIPESLWHAVRFSHNLNNADPNLQSSLLDRCVFFSGLMADFWLREGESYLTTEDLAILGKDSLGLSTDDVETILSKIVALLPEYESLFDLKLVNERDVTNFLNEAREILLLRNLKVIQEHNHYKAHNEALESRNRLLEQQVYTDPLTGLFNRKRLNEVLGQEFDAARHEGWPLSVSFIDIDNFKTINDTYGHHVGDAVIITIAKTITSEMRQTDVIARYGGDEFVLILPGTNGQDAYSVLERLRHKLGNLLHTTDDRQITVTVSIGLATYMTNAPFGNEPDSNSCSDLLQAADHALYTAKGQGRNKTVAYKSQSTL